MPTQVQFRRGTSAQNNSFIGAAGELSIDSDNNSIRVHDGSTTGGHIVAKRDLSNISGVGIITATGIVVTGNVSIGGTLTYEDVTNIDSIGIITARSGVIGDVTGDLTGNADTATALATSRTISLTGDVTGSVSFDGSADVSIDSTFVNVTRTDTTSTASVTHSGTSTVVDSVTTNAQGHVTGVNTKTITWPAGAVPNNGTLTLATSGTGLSGSATFTADDADNVTFTVTSNATSANTASAIVARDGSGNFTAGTITATDFNSTSDINLKKNIEKIESPLDKLTEISGVTFQWIENDKQSGGVIAQDVEKVMPELVGQIEDHKSVNYNGLIGLLVECVKEQQKQIDELKSQIGA